VETGAESSKLGDEKMAQGGKDYWVRFWGVRGSLPTPGAETVKYGGNTGCVEVRCGDQIFIIDMGSGARPLGVELAKEAPLHANIFISHYHYDHICGMPFCGLLYDPQNSFDIYGEGRRDRGLKAILSRHMRYPYFPVGLEIFQAKFRYHTIKAGKKIDKGEVQIRTAPLNHPQSSVAYRLDYKGKSVVYCSDNEHMEEMPRALEKMIRGCDMLIYDAAYTDDEYTGRSGNGSKVGWGHSTWDEAIKTAKNLRVNKLFIYHHDPMNTDKNIDRLLRERRSEFKNLHAAREGVRIKVL
jgi:phosphoribosyl 1,2-cyclic phosphodiesterase